MEKDTQIGGASQFPLTRWSAIVAARSQDQNQRRQAFDVIVQTYWKPVYKTIRIKWRKSNEDAKDLTQAFFTTVLEKNYFDTFDPKKARFRTFIRTCLHGFVANDEKASRRIKRGGDQKTLSLDFTGAENELSLADAVADQSTEDYFDQEWVRHLLATSVEQLRRDLESQNKAVYFAIFERYDLNEELTRPTYDALAQEFDLPVTKVTNYLAFARRQFRPILLHKLREITSNEAEFHSEASALFGLDLNSH